MKELVLTCPFTGQEFTALEYADGRLLVKHPLTGEDIVVNWNCSCQRYYFPKKYLKHVETCNKEQAAEILDVSRQRIAQIVEAQTIPIHMVGGETVFLLSDVLAYKDTRKPGRPW